MKRGNIRLSTLVKYRRSFKFPKNTQWNSAQLGRRTCVVKVIYFEWFQFEVAKFTFGGRIFYTLIYTKIRKIIFKNFVI